jgi:RES domain-containing protein
LSREEVEIGHLTPNWRAAAAPPELVRIGDEFVRRGAHCLLLVPSVLAPREYNWLINPAHPEFRRIEVREPEPVAYDPRMFRTAARRQKP